MSGRKNTAVFTVWVFGMLSLASAGSTAMDFGELGLGTQVLVVNGDNGSQRGLGVNLRTRFLWILGIDFTATPLQSTEEIWMPSTYRLNLVLHPWTSEHFDCYLNPGLSGDAFTDLFDPSGETTWLRIGGGAEARFLDGFALGFEVHWTLPSEPQIERYAEGHSQELWEAYLSQMGPDIPDNIPPEEIPERISELSTSELLDIFPLDRFEFTFGVRYYF